MSIAENRRAYFDYEILGEYEAGLVLTGSEVRAMRVGKATITESYIGFEEGELWLVNASVSVLPSTMVANIAGHEVRRRRKLLLKAKEISKISGEIKRNGMTGVPISLFFNKRGVAKLKIGIGRGKKAYDKRAAEKDKDWDRDRARLMARRS